MLEVLQGCADIAVYVMGGSFVLGSLFTVFLLLILDMLKVVRERKADKS